MVRIYATSVVRWVNDHRTAGAEYAVPTQEMAEAHVRAGWATWAAPVPAVPRARESEVVTENLGPAAGKRAPKETVQKAAAHSSVLAEGDLSAQPRS